MGAVVGIVHLDGGQAPHDDLQVLLEAPRNWGAGDRKLSSDAACFGCRGPESHLSSATRSGAILTAKARLDNRDELSEWLEVRLQDQPSDAALVIRAYERWGGACAERLNGDWALAAWSPDTRELFLARDHFGNTGLYYARIGARVAFASDVKALRRLPWIPRRLNEERIGSLLVGGGIDDAHSTVYRDIARLPPAHSVRITVSGAQLHRYWRVEDVPDRGPTATAERVERVRVTVSSAVASRLDNDGLIGSMLSGGIDSGAVTAFAADHLRRRHRRLTAFTAVPAHRIAGPQSGQGCPDEGPIAAEVVSAFDAIDHVLVPARNVSTLAGIRRGLAIHGEPLIAAANYNWITELLADARARGITRMFTGSVGDFVMAGRPEVATLRGEWAAGRYRAMLKRCSPNWLLRLRQADWNPLRMSEPPWRTFSVVSSDFATETRLLERMRDAARDPRDLKRRPGWAAVVRQATSHVGAIWEPLGASFGLTIVDPLQDKRVMEAMFSGPRPAEARGADRWLFRQSLKGVLPERVRAGRAKGMQSADIVARLLESWPEVEEALRVSEGSPLARRCVDVPLCRTLADAIRRAPAAPGARRAAYVLVNGLASALFLAETWEAA